MQVLEVVLSRADGNHLDVQSEGADLVMISPASAPALPSPPPSRIPDLLLQSRDWQVFTFPAHARYIGQDKVLSTRHSFHVQM